jgi:hypothetical protein
MIPVLNDFEIPEALFSSGSKGHSKQCVIVFIVKSDPVKILYGFVSVGYVVVMLTPFSYLFSYISVSFHINALFCAGMIVVWTSLQRRLESGSSQTD